MDVETVYDKKIKIFITLQNEEVKCVSVTVTNKILIKDLIKEGIVILSDIFYREKIPYKINTDPRKYKLKPSKKSGKPDNDMPGKNSIIYNSF
jgi:hypothetical protein